LKSDGIKAKKRECDTRLVKLLPSIASQRLLSKVGASLLVPGESSRQYLCFGIADHCIQFRCCSAYGSAYLLQGSSPRRRACRHILVQIPISWSVAFTCVGRTKLMFCRSSPTTRYRGKVTKPNSSRKQINRELDTRRDETASDPEKGMQPISSH